MALSNTARKLSCVRCKDLSLDSCGAHNLMHRFKRSKSFQQEACSANEESQWGPGYILRAVRLMEG